MLKNYLKIAIAVLKRRKFFTFISLFGISFTLTILMVLAAFVDKIAGDDYPDKKRDRSLYITNIEETNEKLKNNTSSGSVSYYFLTHYFSGLKTPEAFTVFSNTSTSNTYVNNKKIVINFKYTDAVYWKVLDYDFLEGKPFNKQQVDNGEMVTVISEDIKKEYFGDTPSVVGKYIEANNVKYRISGVVRSLPITSYILYSDIYLPYTISRIDYTDRSNRGGYSAIMLAPSKADVPKMQQEFDQAVRKVPVDSKEFDKLYCHAESYIRTYVTTGDEEKSGMTIVLTAITIFVVFLMLLPTLNLVNINITRVMERSSEIGVRKAFGASSHTLVYQFLIENLILTVLGGLIGIVFSYIIIQIINSASLIANLELSLNLTVLFCSLVACLVFGLISGVYPAWRMSRLKIVSALKV